MAALQGTLRGKTSSKIELDSIRLEPVEGNEGDRVARGRHVLQEVILCS